MQAYNNAYRLFFALACMYHVVRTVRNDCENLGLGGEGSHAEAWRARGLAFACGFAFASGLRLPSHLGSRVHYDFACTMMFLLGFARLCEAGMRSIGFAYNSIGGVALITLH
jgi:hypothetical protein